MKVSAALLGAVSLAAIAAPGHAQTAPAPGDKAAASGIVPADGAPRASEGEDIVVTGSRIARKDYVAESPVVTIGQALIQNNGTPQIEETLNQLPQFNASANGQAQGSSAGAARSNGRATINLRGLGTARTLVLLDGRRLQPSDTLGAVDLNTISSALIDTVEIITGGASAIYGSDAVAGVVNLRTKRKYSGFRLDADGGLTERGDGENLNVAGLYGGSFDQDRGSVLVSGSYFRQGPVRIKDVPFFDDRAGTCCLTIGLLVPSGNNLVSAAALTTVFGRYGTAIPTVGNALGVNADGTLFNVTGGANLRYTAADNFFVAPTNAVQQRIGFNATVVSPVDRYNGFARVGYELSDGVRAFAQLNYTTYTTTSEARGILQATPNTISIRPDNPFIPADFRTLLASRRDPTAPFVYYFAGDRISETRFVTTNRTYQALAGLSGDIALGGATWELYASQGRTSERDEASGYTDRLAFLSLVNAADGGRSICDGGYNPFTLAPVSQSCRNYLTRDTLTKRRYDQQVVEGNVQGALLTLPAGTAQYAFGGAYRRNAYSFAPDNQFVALSLLGTAGTAPSAGSTRVYEAYGELLVPVIANAPLIRSLELDLAYRVSHYNTVGTVSTYKASADWQLFDGMRLRGGYSRAIRAPSVGELFAGRSAVSATINGTTAGGGDPCDVRSAIRRNASSSVRGLCLAQGVPTAVIDTITFGGTAVAGFQSGSTLLREETADSYTVGLVLSPKGASPLLSRLSLSVDYYKISLEGAIANVASLTSLQRCFNADGASNPTYSNANFYCQLISRDVSGQLASIVEPSSNLGGYKTSGIDLQLDWSLRAADFGAATGLGGLDLNVLLSYVDRYAIQNDVGRPFLDYAGTIGNGTIDPFSISHPRWKSTATVTYVNGPARIGLRWRYIDRMTNAANVGTAATVPGVASTSYFDLNARYVVSDKLELRGGIINLGNRAPPVFTGQAATDPATYDLIGRRFFLGVTKTF